MSGQEGAFRGMGLEIQGEAQGRRLNTWKEIASYFGCDERTVKRWEASRGLPVRRLPNGSRSAVFAYEAELKAWLDKGGRETESQSLLAPASSRQRPTRWRFLAPGFIAAGAGLIAALIALQLMSYPSRTEHPAIRSIARPASAEAESFYRAGLYEWQTRTPVGLTRAVDDFTQAIVRDPQYAQAYAGLASCYNLLREYTTMAPDYAFPRAKAAAERAIALDPSLADAHASLAFVDFYWSRDVPGARREFERAVALSPQNATAHHWYATFLMTMREFPRAVAEIDKAEALDVESTAVRADKGFILYYAGRSNEAIDLLRQLEQTEPLFASPHHYLAVIYRARGDDAAFLREWQASADARNDDADKAVASAGAKGLAEAGHAGMLRSILAEQQKLFVDRGQSAYALAQTYAELGDRTSALAFLRTSLARREMVAVDIAIEPSFVNLRENPEFRAIAAQALTPVR